MNLDILKQALPQEQISTDAATIESYKIQNPLVTGNVLPSAVLYPKDFEEVQKVVQAANKNQVKIVTVSSTGPHLREGIACGEEHVVIDLSGWKSVSGMSRRNLVCMVDPGVTYADLLPMIDKEGMMVPMPIAPKSGKSIIAAILDREPASWPNKQWNNQDPLCSLEFAFGSGEKFRTGSAAAFGTIEDQREKAGISHKGPNGPGATGFQRLLMGSQGSMGVVTWATVRLEPKPVISKEYLVEADYFYPVERFVYEVNHPRWGEHQFIMNNTALAMLMTYKNPGDYEKVRDGFKKFICLQSIAGFEILPEERLAYQDKAICELAANRGLAIQEAVGGVAASDVLQTATTPCGDTDWRKALKGECLSIILQTTLDRVGEYMGVFNSVAGMEGFNVDDIGVYAQPMVQNTCCHIEFMLPYSIGEVEKIRSFEEKVVRALNANHAFFSRPYGTAAKIVWDNDPVSTKLLKQMKGLMDPNRVLNPGKFGL